MAVTIRLPAELESCLRSCAEAMGVSAEELATQIIRETVDNQFPGGCYLREDRLLQDITPPFTAEFYRRYVELRDKRRDEVILEHEANELIALNSRLEKWNVSRLTAVLELARLRGVSMEVLMHQLKIGPIPELAESDDE